MAMQRAALLMLLTILASLPARATTLVRLSLEQLSLASSLVARGRVVDQHSQWTPGQRRIVTITHVAVRRTLKGRAAGRLTIEQPGGSVDGVRSRVAGTVSFEPGAEYILFLEPAPSNPAHFLVVGMAQGAFPVVPAVHSSESGKGMVEHVMLPLGTLLACGPAQPVVMQGDMPLGRFLGQIEKALRRPVVVPRGTQIPVLLLEESARGRMTARTVADVYPNPGLVIPAGSVVRGYREVVSGKDEIRWRQIEIRGRRLNISATSLGDREPRSASKVLLLTIG